jgi:hypothetical protein
MPITIGVAPMASEATKKMQKMVRRFMRESEDVVLTKSQTDKGERRFKELQAQIAKSKGE